MWLFYQYDIQLDSFVFKIVFQFRVCFSFNLIFQINNIHPPVSTPSTPVPLLLLINITTFWFIPCVCVCLCVCLFLFVCLLCKTHLFLSSWAEDILLYMFFYLASFTKQCILKVTPNSFIKIFLTLFPISPDIFKGIFSKWDFRK